MEQSSKIVLKTVFNSTYPIDCHIVKGRLETEGIQCFVFDENMVNVNPFNSVAVGGVKLKVSLDQFEKAKLILTKLENNFLWDDEGEYQKEVLFLNEFERQKFILEFKKRFLSNSKILDNESELIKLIVSKGFSEEEAKQIITDTKDFLQQNNLKFVFIWKQFWYELFDFERDFFKYFRVKTNEFYIEKELVEKLDIDKESAEKCPKCGSSNIKFGWAIDYKWDILFIILSFLFVSPFPPYRKKYHCFDCGHNCKNL
jgi:hypothetical protein